MSILATLVGTYSIGHCLSHSGQDFVFARIDQAAKVALDTAYFKRAREAVYLLRGELADGDFDRQLGNVTAAYRRGDFAFPRGETRGYYLGAGLAELTAILTGRPLADCETLINERMIEVFHVCLCVMAESFPQEKKLMLQAPDTPELLVLVQLLGRLPNGKTPLSSIEPPPSPRPELAR